MNILNLLTKFYALQRNYKYVPVRFLSPLRFLTRSVANKLLPRYLLTTHRPHGSYIKDVIISFTSFPARIGNVWMVVESLKNMDVLPEKIILWLSKDQFPDNKDIPDSLWSRIDSLFEIRIVEGDIRSHKKYYYAMSEFPEKTIVTCDDDIFYHPGMLKALLCQSKKSPGCVIANVTRKVKYEDNGDICRYDNLTHNIEYCCAEDLVQIGVGGVLYPPHSLYKNVLDIDGAMKCTPMADDIWLNCMARLNDTPVVQSAFLYKPLGIISEAPALKDSNVGQNLNDKQIYHLRMYLKENGLKDVYNIKSC